MSLIFSYDDLEEEPYTQDTPEFLERNLIEMPVDPGYELEKLDDVDRFYLKKIRERFEIRKDEFISYGDIRASLYAISEKFPKRNKLYNFAIIHMIRRWWRAGEIRRFVKGRSRKTIPGRGGWYGVHYKLYPERKRNVSRS